MTHRDGLLLFELFSLQTVFLMIQFTCDTISLFLYFATSVRFYLGKNARSSSHACVEYVKLCRSNRSDAFFGAQLRLRTFYFYGGIKRW